MMLFKKRVMTMVNMKKVIKLALKIIRNFLICLRRNKLTLKKIFYLKLN